MRSTVTAGGTSNRPPADIAAHLLTREVDLVCSQERDGSGSGDVRADASYRKNTTACGDDLGAVPLGSRLKNECARNVIESSLDIPRRMVGAVEQTEVVDDCAGLGCGRITRSREYDGDGNPVAEGERRFGQATNATGQRHFHQIGFHERQQCLRFGVAKAGVELDHSRTIGREHDAGEQHANEGNALGCHTVDRSLQNLNTDLLGERGRAHRRWRVGTHAAGVGAPVALANTLMILRGGQGEDRATVGDTENRNLFSDKSFLDHNTTVRRQQRANCVGGFGVVRRKDDALSGRESVGLHDHRLAEIGNPRECFSGSIEERRLRSEDTVAFTERSGPRLRRLKLCCGLRRAKGLHTGSREGIGEPGFKRGFRSDDHKFDRLALTERNDAIDIGCLQRNPGTRRARVARRDEQAGAQS
jgi:hypothetical protein